MSDEKMITNTASPVPGNGPGGQLGAKSAVTGVTMKVSGGDVSPSTAAESGEAMRDLMQHVADEMGIPVTAVLKSIGRVCDGCNTPCPSLDLPSGWKNVDGDDLCPHCLAKTPGEDG